MAAARRRAAAFASSWAACGPTFPVAGPHSYGEGFGAGRGNHRHEGVHVVAAEGLAVVAPTAGAVRVTDHQDGGAGEYVVMRSAAGPDFFFAHCVRGSTRVTGGQLVGGAAALCGGHDRPIERPAPALRAVAERLAEGRRGLRSGRPAGAADRLGGLTTRAER